ncbi:DUF1858 domain-containing protein [Litchfieldia salsa]|uniref:DUF1858 domain-containing protein n=1 Tax=Litchfieldia salsa TaxID=930152 RepID=A0A1H0RWD1_9BACI|nr:DUF1858 domain-containing protein [Litchfieldia salsa]SDP33707.1 protein of unknown function [Litchfieldia salsa]
MTKIIDLSQSVYDLCTLYPEIIPIMKDLNFTNITNPTMLQTAGRVMTIPNGCRMKGISLDTVKQAFHEKGFSIIE